MTASQLDHCRSVESFRHEALLYAGDQEFLAGTSEFIRDGLSDDEAILAVVSAAKIAALRDELGPDSNQVQFADISDVDLNRARIIPAWRTFVDDGPVRGRRGIGEPIWADRNPAELVECQRHEALLNVAFEDGVRWSLLCPFDTQTRALEGGTRRRGRLRDRHRPHRDARRRSRDGRQRARHELPAARRRPRRPAVVGGGRPPGLRGSRRRPLRRSAARRPRAAPLDQVSGRGLWVANQLCELVQIRTFPTGTMVRVYRARA